MFPDDKRYIGTIRDVIRILPTYGTKSYDTYEEAYKAAEKLKNEHEVTYRYEVDVIEI